jgi:hypothetical protein
MEVKAHMDPCFTLKPGSIVGKILKLTISSLFVYQRDRKPPNAYQVVKITIIHIPSVQTGSGAHPASCTMGTGVHSPGQSAAGS